MFTSPESFPGMTNTQLETALSFAKISMTSAERMMRLQLEAAKLFIEENAKAAQALASAASPQEIATVRDQLAQGCVEKALGYSRNVYEIAKETQTEIGQLMGERMAAFSKDMTGVVEKALKNAPGGGDAALAAFQSTVAATTAAMDTLTKAAQQAADFTDSGLKTAAAATKDAVKRSTTSGKKR
jgi:phasin family protein